MSFFIYDEDDDPRRPTITIGYNTNKQWRSSLSRAYSTMEAKWNYAFWVQNNLLTLGESGSASAIAVSEWLKDLGLWYTDDEEKADFDRCMEIADQITSRFVSAVCDIALAIHATGIIEEMFGTKIPIIVHELEYYDKIAEQAERCNPPGIAAEFVAWVRGLGA